MEKIALGVLAIYKSSGPGCSSQIVEEAETTNDALRFPRLLTRTIIKTDERDDSVLHETVLMDDQSFPIP